MPEVFDLDAVAAEANGTEPFRFTFGGEQYEMPAVVDIRVVAALTTGDVGAALRRLLGEDQWARMEASDAVFDQARFKALLEAYMAHGGSTLGEA